MNERMCSSGGFRRRRAISVLATLAAGLAVGACTDSPLEPTVEAIHRIVLDRSTVVAESHQETIVFAARVVDSRGREVEGVPLEWASGDSTVLEAVEAGVFRTLTDGDATAVARIPRSYASVSPERYFANVPEAVASVRVRQVARTLKLFSAEPAGPDAESPDPVMTPVDTLTIWAADDHVAPEVRPADAEGETVEHLALPELAWTTVDEAVATVEGGLIRPVSNGLGTVHVTDGALEGQLVVRVRISDELSVCARSESSAAESESSDVCSSVQVTFVRGNGS